MTTPLASARFRFEVVVEGVAHDGTRTRMSTFTIPSHCLVCRRPVIGDDLRVTASVGCVNNVFGFICRNHPGVHL